MTAEQTIQLPVQPPFASAACPRCGHRCEIDPEQPLAPVRCPDCGGEFVAQRPWEIALTNPVARRRFAWALVLGGAACVLGILMRETVLQLAELGLEEYRRGGDPWKYWTAPFLVLLPRFAPLIAIPAQWMLLRLARAEALHPYRVRAGSAWLWAQALLYAVGLLIIAAWIVDPGRDAISYFQADYAAVNRALWNLPTVAIGLLDRATPAGAAIMLLVLGLPPAARIGRAARWACWSVVAGVALPLAVSAAYALLNAMDTLAVAQVFQTANSPGIRSALIHWIPSATVAIGGILLLRTGIRMRGAR